MTIFVLIGILAAWAGIPLGTMLVIILLVAAMQAANEQETTTPPDAHRNQRLK